ncbi:MAG: hypothetical protein NXH82_14100 [Rhodobacteraceae bacterium]|nr:hypothetical protein [Paracoccaceae bacterium]
MSDTDSFIDEVNDEVRRDRLYAVMRRYGWIAVVAILAVVGAAAWSEFSRAQARADAQALGDALVGALDLTGEARAEALTGVTPHTAGSAAVVDMLRAGALTEAGDTEAAVAALSRVAADGDLPEIYRQIAAFKALTLQSDTLGPQERALQFEALARPGAPLRLLAEEQLALIAVETGDTAAAIEGFRALLDDAEATADLQQRAQQAIVALGGSLTAPGDDG